MGQLKRITHEYKFEWAFLFCILGAILTFFGVFGLYPDKAPDMIGDILDAIGAWFLWFVLLGPFMLVIGIWYITDLMKKKREFEELMDTTSKAKFVKNLDRLEELAWHLTMKHQIRIAEKRQEFKIKKR